MLLLLIGGVALMTWQIASLRSQIATLSTTPAPSRSEEPIARTAPPPSTAAPDGSRERFADALYEVLQSRMKGEWDKARPHLLAAYDRAVAGRPDLRLNESDVKGREALGAVLILSDRSADRVEEVMRTALANKGYDPALIDAAAERVRQQLLDDIKKGAP